jgi:hypothetical protein
MVILILKSVPKLTALYGARIKQESLILESLKIGGIKLEHIDEYIVNMVNQADSKSDDGGVESVINEIKLLHVDYNDLDMDMTERLFFDDKFKMYMPANFVKMNIQTAKIKYPSDGRPSIVYMNKQDTVNIGLSLIDESVQDSDMPDVRDFMKQIYSSVNPAAKMHDADDFEQDGHTVAYYSFTSHAIGGQMYNLVFMLALEGKLVVCNLNCLKKDAETLEPLFYGIMKTAAVLPENAE